MKERLDILVVQRGLASSRERAKAMIMAGEIFVAGQREDKPGSTFEDTAEIAIHGKTLPYVSRGGLKLEKAMQVFPLQLTGLVCMDVGASTGGFTDCMLQKGASRVYAVDVGYGQLAWKLRQDERVICMEKTNIRYLTREQLPEPIDFASVDVSFISLTKVLGPLRLLLREDAQVVCLIKPQFEAGREKVGKKGVVREESTHCEVIEAVVCFAEQAGFRVLGLDYSPIRGPEGNIEYLMHARRIEEPVCEEERFFARVDKDFVKQLVLGGDGTLLRSVHLYARYRVPFLGINLGTLGYLTEGSREDAFAILDAVLADRYMTQERMLINGRVFRNGRVIAEQEALNDIVISRSGLMKVINLNLYVNGQYLCNYRADGLITATPTGSTAYNLSVGGPIVDPGAKLMVVTPVSPHSLNNRSLIFSPTDHVRMEVAPAQKEVVTPAECHVHFDGEYPLRLETGDYVEVTRAAATVTIMTMSEKSFLQTLRAKMS